MSGGKSCISEQNVCNAAKLFSAFIPLTFALHTLSAFSGFVLKSEPHGLFGGGLDRRVCLYFLRLNFCLGGGGSEAAIICSKGIC